MSPFASSEVIDDFLGENVGIGKIVGVFEVFVSQPGDVEAGLVAVQSNIRQNQNVLSSPLTGLLRINSSKSREPAERNSTPVDAAAIVAGAHP